MIVTVLAFTGVVCVLVLLVKAVNKSLAAISASSDRRAAGKFYTKVAPHARPVIHRPDKVIQPGEYKGIRPEAREEAKFQVSSHWSKPLDDASKLHRKRQDGFISKPTKRRLRRMEKSEASLRGMNLAASKEHGLLEAVLGSSSLDSNAKPKGGIGRGHTRPHDPRPPSKKQQPKQRTSFVSKYIIGRK